MRGEIFMSGFFRNGTLIEMTKDITIAHMSNLGSYPNAESADNVAAFMDIIYNKLVELNEKANT